MWDIEVYETFSGHQPFAKWLSELHEEMRARVRVRIDRVVLGNWGDCKAIQGGIWELRIDVGPGYRVYFARTGPAQLTLLCGGDKHSQAKDIRKAVVYVNDIRNRHHGAL